MKWRIRLVITVPIAATVLLVWSAFHYWPDHPPSPAIIQQAPISYCAAFGEHETVPLSDGSTLKLNSDACASVAMSPTLRSVRLEKGDAIFEVAHDPTRPFVVKARRASILALGTSFAVSIREQQLDTLISVVSGVVRVFAHDLVSRPIGAPLIAGQQLSVPEDPAAVISLGHISPRQTQIMTAWTTGKIDAGDRPLTEVIAEIQKYHHVTFDVDPRVRHKRLDVLLRTSDMDFFLKALSDLCIRSAYNKETQHVTLTGVVGKPATNCP